MSETAKIDDGGPAFPIVTTEMSEHVEPGMTLRDWFAGQALAGFLPGLSIADEASLKKMAQENGLYGYVTNAQIGASVAYGYADAMIAARKVGG